VSSTAFTVRFPIAGKLLLGFATLLIAAVAGLDIYSIHLVQNEKRAYTFQLQALEAQYTGREMTVLLTRAIDTVRQAIAGVSPAAGITSQQEAAIKALLASQEAVAAVSIAYFDSSSKALRRVAHVGDAGLAVSAERVGAKLGQLSKEGYAFVNASTPERGGLIAVVLGRPAPGAAETVLAVGFVPLRNFGGEIQSETFFIADRDGEVLYGRQARAGDDLFFREAVSSPITAGAKVYDRADGTRHLGSYGRPGLGLVAVASTPWAVAMRPTYKLIEKFVIMGIIALTAAIFFALASARRLAAPIKSLYAATRKVASGDFNVVVASQSRDEVGALAHSFNAMSREIAGLLEDRVRRAKLESDIEVASLVQQRFIPPVSHRRAKIEIEGHYQPAERCGGDWWGFFESGDRLCLMIGDATGHGLSSALITAAIRSVFSVLQKSAEANPGAHLSPSEMMDYANRAIYDAGSPVICMTFFIAVFDFKAGTMTYSNAAHNMPWLYRAGASGKPEAIPLSLPGIMLGESRDTATFREKELRIQSGDTLVIFTDGLTEAANAAGEQYGKRRTRAMLSAAFAKGAAAMIDGVVGDLERHVAGAPLADDVTVVAARVL
jgi:sigma-B regulation protein RsbU (phosphoserine phosphatase)